MRQLIQRLLIAAMISMCAIQTFAADQLPEIMMPNQGADSLAQNEITEHYSESYDRLARLFTLDFWAETKYKLTYWCITQLPLLIGFYILLRLILWVCRGLIKNLKKMMIERTRRDKRVDFHEAEKRINTLAEIISGGISVILWSVFVLTVMARIHINIGPILASAGVVGLAVGFGAQELVRDYISGFFILLENQLRTGDVAVINGEEGLVEKIELRTITLRDFSGTVHIFQNGKINSLANMTKEWSAVILQIGVAYKEDIDHVIDVMNDEAMQLRADTTFGDYIIDDIDVLGLDNFADSAVIIKVIIKTRPMKQWATKREYQRRLKIRFDKEGIEIPFPQVTLHTPAKPTLQEPEEGGAE